MSQTFKRDSLLTTTDESLNTHPLLSPNSPSPLMSVPSNQDNSSTPPRYVPYTPRHRPSPPSAPTSTTAHASIPVTSHTSRHQEGGATTKLQFQNLKATAQSIGLGNGTVGWAMLEKLVDGETGGEWDEIWTTLMTAKPTLLLPLEPFSGESITPDFIKDHLAFYNGRPSSSSPLITLSGLRGSIDDSVLTFRSTIPISSKPFLYLFKSDLQTSVLMSLPPLPTAHPSSTNIPLPSFALPASVSLPLPPRLTHSKPPLPPRPGTSSSIPAKSQASSRITNPFASLFGRPLSSASSSVLSTSPSQMTIHVDEAQNIGVIEVTAFSLGRKIIKKSVGKELSKVVKEEISAGLSECPAWVVDRVLDFTGPLHPIPRTSRQIEISHDSSTTRSGDAHSQVSPVLPPATQLPPNPSSLADAFQIFYTSIENELRAMASGKPSPVRKRTEKIVSEGQDDSSITEFSEDGKEDKQREDEEEISETRIREVLDRVESVVCTVFYERTFRPITGDDISHDDALANRIAALSLLDLGLEHLGVEIPNEIAKNGVDDLVRICGEALQELEDPLRRSPKEKSDILVQVHKILVEGLARLPQLRLKPEHDFEDPDHDQKTPRSSSFAKQAAHDAIDETSPSSSVPFSNTQSNSNSEAPTIITELDSAPAPPPTSIPTLAVSDSLSENVSAAPSTSGIPEMLGIDSAGFSLRGPSPSTFPHSHSLTSTPSPSSPNPVSGDLLFPLLIFSVVKSNPAHLVSHLLYTQRFRSRSVGGQESYCLINLMAVVEFLENVDMGALGLGDSERVMSTADLTPIPLAHGSVDQSTSPTSPLTSRLGKRVNQQVEELAGLAGSANKVITGVVDSSFGVLRSFLTSNPDFATSHDESHGAAPWNNMRTGFGMLRRASGFSIASVAASLPGTGRPKAPNTVEEGQQLIEVSSRPGSIREAAEVEGEGEEPPESGGENAESVEGEVGDRGDARSVRSFSSMMSKESRDRDRFEGKERLSLTDRLVNMSRLGSSGGDQNAVKASPPSSRPASRPTSWLAPPTLPQQPSDSSGGNAPSHLKARISPPNRRFLECSEQDIRVGEVGELLREYRRMVQALHSAGAFEDHV